MSTHNPVSHEWLLSLQHGLCILHQLRLWWNYTDNAWLVSIMINILGLRSPYQSLVRTHRHQRRVVTYHGSQHRSKYAYNTQYIYVYGDLNGRGPVGKYQVARCFELRPGHTVTLSVWINVRIYIYRGAVYFVFCLCTARLRLYALKRCPFCFF